MSQNISLVTNHLPGHLNTVADRESRVLLDRWDWQLHPKIFFKINQIWGPLTTDLFASRLTHQLLAYFSWRPDPQALAVDALLQDWLGKICYANPPWGLMLKVLSEISHRQAYVIIVWYSSFVTSCSQAPNRESLSVFLMYSIKTCVFNHSTRVFKFVFGFTSVRSSSNSSGTHCKYVTSSDSSLLVHTISSRALLEQ